MTAADKILQQALVGSGIDSAAWSQIQASVRDRAFFSATVTDLRTLDNFRSNVAALVSSQKSPSEIRRDLRAYLSSIGYDAGDNRGTIKDLMTQKRLDVMMKTNADQAKGYVSHLRATTAGAILAFPAYELVRVERRMLPRDWRTRWRNAASKVGWQGVAKGTDRMIALKTSPVWVAISAFGNPFPPFDFNSGMGLKDVKKSECRDLGLLGPDEQPEIPPVPDFNQNLTAALPNSAARAENAAFIREKMGDLASVEGGTIAYKTPDFSRALRLPGLDGLVSVSPEVLRGIPKELLALIPALLREKSGKIESIGGKTLSATVENGVLKKLTIGDRS